MPSVKLRLQALALVCKKTILNENKRIGDANPARFITIASIKKINSLYNNSMVFAIHIFIFYSWLVSEIFYCEFSVLTL